jgi:hypothetical protein
MIKGLSWKRFLIENVIFFILFYKLPLVIQIILAVVFSLVIEAFMKMRDQKIMIKKLNKRFGTQQNQNGA